MPAKKRVTRSVWVDPDDAPEWTQDQFDRASLGEVWGPDKRSPDWPK
jgi:hypothetical protein